MTHFEAGDVERDVHLDAWYRDLMKVEQALTEAEQREARIAAREQTSADETAKRFGPLIGKGGM